MSIQAKLRAEYYGWTTQPERCAICWIPSQRLAGLRFNDRLELAHIISRARGGDVGNVVGNTLFLCSSCHGAQHQSGYNFNGAAWPDIKVRHLLRAKLELGELSIHDLAGISGYTPGYILDLTSGTLPGEIVSERLRWCTK